MSSILGRCGVVDGGVTVVGIAERGSSPVDKREELELSVFLYVPSMTSVKVDVCRLKLICLGCVGPAVHVEHEVEDTLQGEYEPVDE